MKTTVFRAAALWFPAVLLAGCGSVSEPDSPSILVFGAASTMNALDEINTRFERESGIRVHTSYAASSTLAQQIASGADADVFLSANTQWADFLESERLVAGRRDLLENRLVIIVPTNSQLEIRGPADLVRDEVKHIALADPDAAPAGIYAKQALCKLKLWESLRGKIVPGSDVRQALCYVEAGAAEAGIVYATDAAATLKVNIAAEIPPGLTTPIIYPAVLLKKAENDAAAKSFFQYVNSPQAAEVFREFGFVVPVGGRR